MSFFAHFRASDDSNQYSPDTEDGVPLLPSSPAEPALKQHHTRSKHSWAPALICALALLANIFLTTARLRAPAAPAQLGFTPALAHRREIGALRRPSQYIGFDALPRNTSAAPREFMNFPRLAAQLDAAAPRATSDLAYLRNLTEIGTISPGVVRVVVGDTVSTLLQFRAVDWGMERCELHVHLPLASSGEVEIYRVHADSILDASTLSHATRPPRQDKVANAHIGGEAVYEFACALEEVLSFELACAEGALCETEWVQGRNKEAGVWVVQRETA